MKRRREEKKPSMEERRREKRGREDKNLTVPSIGIFLFDLLLYPLVIQTPVISENNF